MDLLRIAVRAVFAFVVLHAVVRAAGKRTVSSSGPFDFVLSLVIGDLVDNVIWSEVTPAQFAAAVSSLVILHFAVSLLSFGAGRIAPTARKA
ncbi:MAG TPA: hypothetical protein VK886_04865 [Vicinamibacterales bacterium]|nr:hypothetical protein [Vicinamibacterales bacterium]